MIRVKTFFLFIVTVLSVPRGGFAEPSPVIQAALVDFPPLSFHDQKQITGSYVDYFKLVEKRSGLKIAVQIFPFLRAIDRVQTGASDITVIPSVEGTKAAYSFKIPMYKARYVLLSRKKKPFCSLPEVHGEIGRLRGGCQNLLDDKKVHYFDVSSYKQGLTMLQSGRLDGFCGVEVGLAHIIKSIGLDTSELTKFVMLEKDQVIYFSPKFSKAQFEKFEKAALDILKEGAFKTIQDKHREPSGFLSGPDCEKPPQK